MGRTISRLFRVLCMAVLITASTSARGQAPTNWLTAETPLKPAGFQPSVLQEPSRRAEPLMADNDVAETVAPLDEATEAPPWVEFDPGDGGPYGAREPAYFPWWQYTWFAINGANRGLGYEGTYFTGGGLVPMMLDSWGGTYFAEGRIHVSENGRFFVNAGLGRRQYVDPSTTFGFSAWYDFDDDQADIFGHAFHQVGFSADVLNEAYQVRANGYFPLGEVDYQQSGFSGNHILVRSGLDSALTGVDAEVGVRLAGPAPSGTWFHVGGYAYSSALVERFGGVSARIEVPGFGDRAKFQFELNHDDQFKTTGFLGLVLTPGGCNAFSAPLTGLQPTQRNDHIVRVHVDPIIALNPDNGMDPWRIFFADNSATENGDGTFENPFDNLEDTVAAANEAFDIIFVQEGTGTAFRYDTEVRLLEKQQLLGDGVAHRIDTQFGIIQLRNSLDGLTPRITNSGGTAVILASGTTVSGVDILNAPTAISADATVLGGEGNEVTIEDVNIFAGTTGIELRDTAGNFNVTNLFANGVDGNAVTALNTTGNLVFNGTQIDGRDINNLVTLRTVNGFFLNTVSRFELNGGSIMDLIGDGVSLTNSTAIIQDIAFNRIGDSAVDAAADLDMDTTILVQRNTMNNMGGTDGIFLSTSTNGRVAATLRDNSIDMSIPATNAIAAVTSTGLICLDASGNNTTVSGTPPSVITLNPVDGPINVTQTSSEDLSAVNFGAFISENPPDTVNFNAGPCPQP